MKNSKRLFAVLLAAAMIMAALIGCGTQNGAKPGEDTTQPGTAQAATSAATEENSAIKDFVTLKVLYPGDMSARMKDFLDNEFKAKMKDELNLGMEVSYSPWDQYWNKKDMMLAAGEQIDWFWDGITNLNKMVTKKQVMDIGDVLNKYGTDLKKVIPEGNFEGTTINGKIMGIPSCYAPSAAPLQLVDVRQDLLEGVGMTDIKTSADLEQFVVKTKEKYPDTLGGSFNLLPALTREFADQVYVFITDSYLLAVGQNDNKVYSYYETDAFKKVAKFNRELYLKKLYNDEVTIKYNEHDARMKTGKYIWGEGSIAKPMEIIQDVRKNAPDAKLKTYMLGADKPKYITTPGNEVICISSTSKYPERAMMFLNWIYQSKDNYNFALYGVNDKDYKMENNRLKLLTNDVFFYEWMFRNVNYMEFPDTVDDDFINTYKAWDDGAKYANTFGFTFDTSSVKNEEAKLIAEVGQKLQAIATGFIDNDENYAKAIDGLKKAGIDKYKEECQKQFDAFLASKK